MGLRVEDRKRHRRSSQLDRNRSGGSGPHRPEIHLEEHEDETCSSCEDEIAYPDAELRTLVIHALD